LGGTPRVLERLKGQLQMAGTIANVAGTVRVAPVRLRSTGIILAYKAAPTRVSERLTSVLGTKVAVAGKVRVYERLRATLGFAAGGPTTAVAGKLRFIPERIRSTGIILAYKASKIRHEQRLRGTISAGQTSVVAGRIRTLERIKSLEIITNFYASEMVVPGVRFKGATLTSAGGGAPTNIVGTAREGIIRLRGAALRTYFAAVPVRLTGPRLTGFLTTKLVGRIRAGVICRLRGNALTTSRVSLSGTVRDVLPRNTAFLAMQTPTALRGYIRGQARLYATALGKKKKGRPRTSWLEVTSEGSVIVRISDGTGED